jgi:hypothetical protein
LASFYSDWLPDHFPLSGRRLSFIFLENRREILTGIETMDSGHSGDAYIRIVKEHPGCGLHTIRVQVLLRCHICNLIAVSRKLVAEGLTNCDFYTIKNRYLYSRTQSNPLNASPLTRLRES